MSSTNIVADHCSNSLMLPSKQQVRLRRVLNHLQPEETAAGGYVADYRAALGQCKAELAEFIDQNNCNPILVRLAWHDCGTFDRTLHRWPNCGGANASIRFQKELSHGANAGLPKAVSYLKPFKLKYPQISWADLIQLASVTAIELTGGPVIPIRFGRVDVERPDQCPPEGNLPSAEPPFGDGSPDAATHLRRVFYRMGFNDQEIVALSGAHTLGRAFRERSGTVSEGYGTATATKYTKSPFTPRCDGAVGHGMSGGRSWTPHWLSFDTEYFSKGTDDALLKLSTDKVLFVDPSFRQFAEGYGDNPGLFVEDYTAAHKKLSELGSKFYPSEGFYL